ncbi:MAG: ribose 5-phosphate isomerase B [Phycisphaerae bacterium]|nr:ribose 5-phosphate isomerase B [Phycisphaerae bacterium]
MKIALSSDHRGFHAKERLKAMLSSMGHEFLDFGCNSPASCDYPDAALPAAACIAKGEANFGIMMCGSGIGMSITANKVCGIRAALCHDELTAELSRKHNDANVLCLPADLIGEELIKRVVHVWLVTTFEGGRHQRRLTKIAEFENNNGRPH